MWLFRNGQLVYIERRFMSIEPEGTPPAGGGGGSGAPPKQPPLPGVTPPTPPTENPWETKAKAAQKEVADMKAAAKTKKTEEADAKKKTDEADALKRGEHEKVIAKQKLDLDASNKKIAAWETATKERIDKLIEKLPEATRTEIGLIKDNLPLDKLEVFVMGKNETITNPPPAPPTGPRSKPNGKFHTLHQETEMVLDEVYKSGAKETGKHIGLTPLGGKGDHVVRWRGTGDPQKDTAAFIELLNNMSQNPLRDMQSAARKRILGEK